MHEPRSGEELPVTSDEVGRGGPARPEPLPDRLGRYRVIARLGSGGFGVVYHARDEELGREVAVKVPHPRRLSTPEDVEAYLREARTLAGLDHPGILPVYDFGRSSDGHCYLVSKYVEGGDLSRWSARRPLSPYEAASLIAQVAEALHHAHQRGLVHRDVKPANVLLGAAGQPFLADFGLALRDEDFGKGPAFAGTPFYMSPEQARREGHRVDARTDVYGLGVVFYELLTGRRPFQSPDLDEVLEQIVTLEPRPPRQFDDAIPRELDRICLKALSKRAADRFSTARDFADELRHWMASAGAASAVTSASPRPIPTDAPTPPASATPAPSSQQTAQTVPAPAPAPKVVPKGLRSFDARDADFFLELLPGPRDRHGLPDSLRFWKAGIEAGEAEQAFPVGLLYGPSGCGKSSLVKAGLLACLSGHVLPVYVEATPEDTEARLWKGLQRRCPGLNVPDGADPARSLVAVLAELRRGRGLPPGQKLLLVIDQFEQYLHERRDDPNPALVQALRQCDGLRVQCLVMVRDDFWMAATRFMREVEVRLVEGFNSAAVDLFDLRHARKVLGEFGRAFGCLPEDRSAWTAEQERFLDQAVASLAVEHKVVSVRLSLFADMVKSRPWTPATLEQVGGAEGIGVTFLEETFGAATAPPQHRMHQKAARAVLEALLPAQGTEIKGHMRSREELLQLSGYARRPRDFDDLMRMLDNELRLVTPTDPEGALADGADAAPAGRYYQLTHDYLVPALRLWLTRKQRETARGRASLLLAELAALWGVRPATRHLPSLGEWLRLRFWTRSRDHNDVQGRMMRSANRYHAIRSGLFLCLIAAMLGLGVFAWYRQQDKDAEVAVERLLASDVKDAPKLVGEVKHYWRWARPRLAAAAADDGQSARRRLRARLALLETDESQVDPIYEQLLESEPDELLVLRDFLRPHRETLSERLWTLLLEEQKGKDGAGSKLSSQRFRAACALAGYQPDDPRWRRINAEIARRLANENPLQLSVWKEALRPVRDHLLDPLVGLFEQGTGVPGPPGAGGSDSLRAVVFSNLLLDYAADRPDVLVRVLRSTDPNQYAAILPLLRQQSAPVLKVLAAQLAASSAGPSWIDAPLPAKWSNPLPAALLDRFRRAEGMVKERFALCQKMPLREFEESAETLRAWGYRPTSFRPYVVGDSVLVAATWTRDERDWKMAHGLTLEQLRAQDAQRGKEGYKPLDLAGYVLDDGKQARYAVLWVKKQSGAPSGSDQPPGPGGGQFDTVLYAGLTPEAYSERMIQDGSFGARTHFALTVDGEQKHHGVLLRNTGLQLGFGGGALGMFGQVGGIQLGGQLGALGFGGGMLGMGPSMMTPAPRSSFWYANAVNAGQQQMDVRLGRALSTEDRRRVARQQVAAADKALEKAREQPAATLDFTANYQNAVNRHARANARFLIGERVGALEDIRWLVENVPWDPEPHRLRALLLARAGDKAAEDDVKHFARKSNDLCARACLEAQVAVHLGKADAGLAALEKALADYPRDPRFLAEVARVHAVASAVQERAEQGKGKANADKALKLLEQAFAAGYADPEPLLEADWDALRAEPRFRKLLESEQGEVGYTATWSYFNGFPELHGGMPPNDLGLGLGGPPILFDSQQTHGLAPEAHLLRCQELAQEGYRPTAISVAFIEESKALRAASVWQRPAVTSRERSAEQQARLAITLAELGEPDRLWPLLTYGAEPTLRDYLIHRMGPLGFDLDLLQRRLDDDLDPGIRQALVLALGEYPANDLSEERKRSLLASLTRAYHAPDAGVRAAADWLLRRWKQDPAQLPAPDESRERPKAAPTWRAGPNGHTLSVIPGPAVVPVPAQFSPGDVQVPASFSWQRVRIPRSYSLSTTEVTVGQFQAFLRARPALARDYPGIDNLPPDQPMTRVSWLDATQYCRWLGELEKLPEDQQCYPAQAALKLDEPMQLAPGHLGRKGYRLPTQAEWFHAWGSNGASTYVDGWSSSSPGSLMVHYGWTPYNPATSQLSRVGLLKPNRHGLFDMTGNATEWCHDALAASRPRPVALHCDDRESPTTIFGEFDRLRCGMSIVTPTLTSDLSFGVPRENEVTGFRVARTEP